MATGAAPSEFLVAAGGEDDFLNAAVVDVDVAVPGEVDGVRPDAAVVGGDAVAVFGADAGAAGDDEALVGLFFGVESDRFVEELGADLVAAERVDVEHADVGVFDEFAGERCWNLEASGGGGGLADELVLHAFGDFEDVLDIVVLGADTGERLAVAIVGAADDPAGDRAGGGAGGAGAFSGVCGW